MQNSSRHARCGAGHPDIRVNDQWRVGFEWRDGHAYEVEIVDYHWETTGWRRKLSRCIQEKFSARSL
jgi:hypothetical protein